MLTDEKSPEITPVGQGHLTPGPDDCRTAVRQDWTQKSYILRRGTHGKSRQPASDTRDAFPVETGKDPERIPGSIRGGSLHESNT